MKKLLILLILSGCSTVEPSEPTIYGEFAGVIHENQMWEYRYHLFVEEGSVLGSMYTESIDTGDTYIYALTGTVMGEPNSFVAHMKTGLGTWSFTGFVGTENGEDRLCLIWDAVPDVVRCLRLVPTRTDGEPR